MENDGLRYFRLVCYRRINYFESIEGYLMDNQKIESGIAAYNLGKRFAERLRIGKRFYGSMRLGMRIYGITYKTLNEHENRFELDMFVSGFHKVLGTKQVSIDMQTNLINGFSDQWGNK